MKTVKLWFTGFWEDFQPEDNMFTSILQKRYHVVLDEKEPDFLICSPLGQPFSYMRYDCPRIMYTGEFQSVDFTAIDYFIGYDDISFGDRAYRFPLFLYSGSATFRHCEPLTEDQARQLLREKTHFCNYIFGHDTELGVREQILEGLSAYKRVDCAGRHRNNMPGGLTYNMQTKIDFMRQCKFSICAESVRYPGYTSEKIGHAFDTYSIPVYFGAPDTGVAFNEDAFVDFDRYRSVEAMVDKVIQLDQDDDMYIAMLCQPRYNAMDYEEKMMGGLESFLYNIFDQDKEEAYRRPRFYRSHWHESYLKEYNHTLNALPYKVLRKLGV